MEKLDLVKELLARLPTRKDQTYTQLRINVRVGSRLVRAHHSLVRNFLAALPSDLGLKSDAAGGRLGVEERDRGTPRGATPPTPPGIRVRTTAVRSG